VIRILAFAAILAGVPVIAFAGEGAPLAPTVPVVPSADAGNAVVAQGVPSPAPSASPAAAAAVTPEPSRRSDGQDAPMDSIFPNADFGGPLIGTNVDPTGYPLETFLAKNSDFGKFLDTSRIRVYGWLNGGVELTNSSSQNTFPISYNPVANRLELDQAVIRIERYGPAGSLRLRLSLQQHLRRRLSLDVGIRRG
jgi:hypothetical protein